jgi:hypothetical protein
VPFRRLSERAVHDEIRARAPELSDEEVTTLARVSAGRLDRADRLLDPAAAQRREALLGVARSVYLDPAFDAGEAAQAILAGIAERGAEARERAEESVAVLELTGREAEQRIRRSQRGAERDELLAALEELEWWYRDLVVVAAGAEAAAVHVDRLDDLRADAGVERLQAAERACEAVRAAWRDAEELQLSAPLALEALLVRLRRELAGAPARA